MKRVTLRIDEEMLKRLKCVAEHEGRSINSHLLVLARQDINDFEAAHGTIDGHKDDKSNVKPPDKTSK